MPSGEDNTQKTDIYPRLIGQRLSSALTMLFATSFLEFGTWITYFSILALVDWRGFSHDDRSRLEQKRQRLFFLVWAFWVIGMLTIFIFKHLNNN